ncbi:GAF domain-containing sensor histidine kinase [Chroogloeocystis siderophila]|jgi:two-component system sensor histidine kinase/response regulator|uniref:histidine kinase n=1 Tax=Chroogloeocystis siderophila 5.2 s.c.1 TaxID=247279 RepID=A0A1U7HZP5_9CHRO|nr:GAF domain-containing sensor histidine kinase [Chroogloeocystis siderophila]OKH29077.1 ATPase [Chroogloeocystis siderophila 5.2 s.c.1]
MFHPEDLSFRGTLPLAIFEQLKQLLHQMAQVAETEAVVLTQDILLSIPVPQKKQQFIVIISQGFSALLLGFPEEPEQSNIQNSIKMPDPDDAAYFSLPAEFLSFDVQEPLIDVNLTFDRDAIANFLQQLSYNLQHDFQASQTLAQYCQSVQPNDTRLQSYFTLLLLSIFNKEKAAAPQAEYPSVSVCQPVEDALKEQIAHERLLNQLTSQIRQSLDLSVILSTAVSHVRDFLQLDRLMIYQFAQDSDHEWIATSSQGLPASNTWQKHSGCVVYEARAAESIPSMLNYREAGCFIPTSQCWEKYRKGFTLAVDDIEKTYVLSQCLLEFLRASQVRAKLAAPIVLQEKLWGLLIAHQCHDRHWRDSEKKLLQRIAEQLAIAINQAELMQSLTREKQLLEQRVSQRTQALQDALIAAQAANRAKSEFLATMSHELRSPLTTIIGLSATLLRWSFGQLTERQRQYLDTIHNSGEHLLALINDILTLSEVEAGKTLLEKSEFSLSAIAEASMQSFRSIAARQAVDLCLDLRIDTSRDRIIADFKRVQQILWNLLSNAVKFTPAGGRVILRAWLEHNIAVLQVEDTGIGIPTDQLPLLFEKFQQLDTPYRRQYEGTGLGLALTKHLVELHQGRIEVESVVGHGSIFTVWLPRVEE